MRQLTHNQKIWLIVSTIPKGKVATYGQVAELAGLPNAARIVGNVLSQVPPGSSLPWHRVINSQGKISLPPGSARYQAQKQRLEQEGIIFIEARLNLGMYRWDGISD